MIEKKNLGLCHRGDVDAYTLDNGKGLRVTVLTLGPELCPTASF